MTWSIKKFLEETYEFAGEPKQRPGDQVRGTERPKKTGYEPGTPYKKHPFQGKLVGGTESVECDLEEKYLNEFEDFVQNEGKIKDIDLQRQDHERMTPQQFYAAYGITKKEWRLKYGSMFKTKGVAEAVPTTPQTPAQQAQTPQSPQEKAAAAKALATQKTTLQPTTGIDPMKLAKGDLPSMKKAAQVMGDLTKDPAMAAKIKPLLTAQQAAAGKLK